MTIWKNVLSNFLKAFFSFTVKSLYKFEIFNIAETEDYIYFGVELFMEPFPRNIFGITWLVAEDKFWDDFIFHYISISFKYCGKDNVMATVLNCFLEQYLQKMNYMSAKLREYTMIRFQCNM